MLPNRPAALPEDAPHLPEADPIQDLLDQLLKHADPPTAPKHAVQGNQEVLLDVSVGELRCLIFKQKPTQASVRLSPREREIARMLAKGYPNKTIAAVLDISSWTVSTYLRRMFAKLDVHSRTALVTALFKQGILSTATLESPGHSKQG